LKAGGVPRRYARALAEVAAGSGELERVQQDLAAVTSVLAAQRDLARLLRNPSVPREAAAQALDRVAQTMGLAALTRRFLGIVVRAGRLEALEAILRVYATLADERRGRLQAEVTTAAELPAAQLAQLRERLSAVRGRHVYLEVRRDPALLGGMVTRIGSEVYDGSLRTQLARLREALVAGG
jgi:F-type H+-transporting ATPase subunit delta